VAEDVILGENLPETIALITERPLLVVVLTAPPEVIAAREAARGKVAYQSWAAAQLHARPGDREPAGSRGGGGGGRAHQALALQSAQGLCDRSS
jgi:hypothetical protein